LKKGGELGKLHPLFQGSVNENQPYLPNLHRASDIVSKGLRPYCGTGSDKEKDLTPALAFCRRRGYQNFDQTAAISKFKWVSSLIMWN